MNISQVQSSVQDTRRLLTKFPIYYLFNIGEIEKLKNMGDIDSLENRLFLEKLYRKYQKCSLEKFDRLYKKIPIDFEPYL